MEGENNADTDFSWCWWNNPEMTEEGIRRLRNQRSSKDHPNYSIITISLITEQIYGDLRWLAVSQTLAYDCWKNSRKSKIIIGSILI